MTLKGKHAVVTGGATGIGLAITMALCAAGASVTIMGRNKKRLDKIAASEENVSAIAMDVTNQTSVKNAFSAASKISPISILINNAGSAKTDPFHKISYEKWQKMLDVNLTGVFLTTQAALADIKAAKNGRIINIASTSGLKGHAYASAYSAAKHGVIGLTRSLSIELSKTEITVNAICPGFTNTDIVAQALENITAKTGRSREEALNDLLATDGQKRLVEPDEVADEVLKLCDPKNRSINGKAIVMNGDEIIIKD